jgi:hypothetical protein
VYNASFGRKNLIKIKNKPRSSHLPSSRRFQYFRYTTPAILRRNDVTFDPQYCMLVTERPGNTYYTVGPPHSQLQFQIDLIGETVTVRPLTSFPHTHADKPPDCMPQSQSSSLCCRAQCGYVVKTCLPLMMCLHM